MSIFPELTVIRVKRGVRAEKGGGVCVMPRHSTGTIVATYVGGATVEFDPLDEGGGWLGDVPDEVMQFVRGAR